MKSRTYVIASLLAVVGIVAGCGGSTRQGGGPTSPAPSPSPLTVQDFPRGWSAGSSHRQILGLPCVDSALSPISSSSVHVFATDPTNNMDLTAAEVLGISGQRSPHATYAMVVTRLSRCNNSTFVHVVRFRVQYHELATPMLGDESTIALRLLTSPTARPSPLETLVGVIRKGGTIIYFSLSNDFGGPAPMALFRTLLRRAFEKA
jgi:hypothetical protein